MVGTPGLQLSAGWQVGEPAKDAELSGSASLGAGVGGQVGVALNRYKGLRTTDIRGYVGTPGGRMSLGLELNLSSFSTADTPEAAPPATIEQRPDASMVKRRPPPEPEDRLVRGWLRPGCVHRVGK